MSDDESWGDWVAEGAESYVPFSGAGEAQSLDEALDLSAAEGLDLRAILRLPGLGFHDRVKVVNFVRAEAGKGRALAELNEDLSPGNIAGLDDAYLKPVLEDDAVLQALAMLDDDDEDELEAEGGRVAPEAQAAVTREQALEAEVAALRGQLAQATALLRRVSGLEGGTGTGAGAGAGAGAPVPSQVSKVPTDVDGYYFDSYSHHGIHAEMLQDHARTEAYRRALEESGVCRGKDVLDVGCGTGVLSIFAARGGAARVVGVDNSAFAEEAQRIVERNGFADRVTIVRGKAEEVAGCGADGKVDVIVSEWMGYALLFENMLDSVLDARDRLLRPGGLMLPSRATMHMSGASDDAWWHRHVGFWGDVYGIDMSHLAPKSVTESDITVVPAKAIATDFAPVADIDLATVTPTELTQDCAFVMRASRACALHYLVLHFDVDFPAGEGRPVTLSTSPAATPTHWKQTIFPLPRPLQVAAGTEVRAAWRFERAASNPREWRARIRVTDPSGGEDIALDFLVK